MNVYALQRIMGHPGLSVLRRYLALLDDDLQEAHRRFGAVDQLLAQGVRGPRAFDRPAWVRVISIEGKKSIKRVV